MLTAVELNPPSPTATTWRMWIVASSMYDAYAAFDRDAIGTVPGHLRQTSRRPTAANRARAVSYAAHRALTFTFPDQAAIFDSVLALHDDSVDIDGDPRVPKSIGQLAADRVIAHRLDDGSNAQNGFAEITSATYPTLTNRATSTLSSTRIDGCHCASRPEGDSTPTTTPSSTPPIRTRTETSSSSPRTGAPSSRLR